MIYNFIVKRVKKEMIIKHLRVIIKFRENCIYEPRYILENFILINYIIVGIFCIIYFLIHQYVIRN